MHAQAAVFALALSGCQLVFSLDEPPRDASPDDAAIDAPADADVFQLCAPTPREMLRYGLVTTSGRFQFDSARAFCAWRGMDLLVINDPDEYMLLQTNVAIEWSMRAPVLLGIQDVAVEGMWTAIDACAVHEMWAADEGDDGSAQNCAAIGSGFVMLDGDCEGFFDGTQVQAAGCEVRRPPTAACRDSAARSGGLFAPLGTQRATFDDARLACGQNGGRLLEINSTAERDAARATAGTGMTFWVNARWDGMQWISDSMCPQLIPFGTPTSAPSTGSCAMVNDVGTAMYTGCTSSHVVVCEPL